LLVPVPLEPNAAPEEFGEEFGLVPVALVPEGAAPALLPWLVL
jgi:hypothetical protein